MNTDNKKSRYVNMVLDRVKQYYNLKTDASLAVFLEIQPNTLAMQRSRGTLPIDQILEKCANMNMNWLLCREETGQVMHTLDQAVSYDASESLRVQELQSKIEKLERELKSSPE